MGSRKSSKFVCVRNAPEHWDENLITKKFSLFGPVEEVTIETPISSQNKKGNLVIIEFENECDAAEAIEDINEEYTATLYFPQTSSSYMYVDPVQDPKNSRTALNEKTKAILLPCSNSNCTHQLLKCDKNIYCQPECYFQSLDTNNIDIYDKWISSLGRSGSGMLENCEKMDRLVIKVDPEGNRSCIIRLLQRAKIKTMDCEIQRG